MRGKPYPFERNTSKITGPVSPGFCRSFSVFAVHRLIDKNASESKVQLQLSDDLNFCTCCIQICIVCFVASFKLCCV